MNTEPNQPETDGHSAPGIDPQVARRRKFLNGVCIAMGTASLASIMAGVIAFLLSPLEHSTAEVWRTVGKVNDFKIGSTSVVTLEDASSVQWAGYAGKTAAYLRRDDEASFTCFSINCTHLGCPVRWIDSAQLFMCPCHGGVYYKDGAVAAGPPPLPLPKYRVRILNGQVQVLASPVPITRGV